MLSIINGWKYFTMDICFTFCDHIPESHLQMQCDDVSPNYLKTLTFYQKGNDLEFMKIFMRLDLPNSNEQSAFQRNVIGFLHGLHTSQMIGFRWFDSKLIEIKIVMSILFKNRIFVFAHESWIKLHSVNIRTNYGNNHSKGEQNAASRWQH